MCAVNNLETLKVFYLVTHNNQILRLFQEGNFWAKKGSSVDQSKNRDN